MYFVLAHFDDNGIYLIAILHTSYCFSKFELARSSLNFSQHGPISELSFGNGRFIDHPKTEVLI